MNYKNGSILGVDNTPTGASASGIWDINSVRDYKDEGVWPGTGASIEHTAVADDEVDRTTYTFSGMALGAADASRRIVVCAFGRAGSTRTIDSITVQGISGSEVVTALNTTSAFNRGSIWIVDVPTGTTGDVVVTFSGGMLRAGVSVYRMVGAASGTAADTNSDIAISSNAFEAPLTIPAGGVGVGYVANASGAVTWTWTNLDEDMDGDLGTTGTTHSSASSAVPGAATRTATASGSPTNGGVLLLAAWN